MIKKKTEILNLLEKGQTAVEYLLMLLVVVTILYTLSGRVYKYFLGDIKACNRYSQSFVCRLYSIYNIDNYLYFRLRR
ncbi:MAG: hypothetical protein A2381_04285 [Bdellovibrionales bacterium RIFOXYB1_FULL_37_110]|nr:MAG: hypothetical protein A2181_09510 [Bdellovibrionales bacterium RIFOXYA1_FULL_38_20]OFZ46609.1 MAG: hypothetical protein A2417_04570 [Bdellovibrionales bacterium RIFOXYC1_FULL_37_79]OFZ52694.1 MAG: hypothetical protein A2328_07320 [Bdellovibrionales bacterium RIFOXYB2_FULL_36_6]OFZ57463.1 MAG: hypothetical protein A2381_04285 [Bdellovibrionales bacterium RIFOXYB1_FULL_37_110]OFZ64548.1 MAG: hypothetical protein A2577_13760 [Bdellovibrionales bacterium RIFOXYD1_FULL_36_51]